MSTPPFLQNIYQKPTMDAEGQQTNGEYTKVAHDDTHDDPPPFHSSRSNNGNDDSEEMLPLYTEMHARHSASDSITPPAATATPDQVRDFIVELLTTTRGLHIDHARRVAARWTLGNGQEMRAYPPWMYRDIFGFEDGWIVYKEVHVVLHNATRSRRRATGMTFLGVAILWVVVAGLVFGLSPTDSMSAFVGGAMGVLGFWVLIATIVAVAANSQKAEHKVEMALKASYNKGGETPVRR